MRSRESYFVKTVKRRLPTDCRVCKKNIEKGDSANILEIEHHFGFGLICIAITCGADCTEEFITNSNNYTPNFLKS